MGKVITVCTSDCKGLQKHDVNTAHFSAEWGIAEAMRAESLKITKHAMISRAASVIRGKTLIINLPGSPRACMENMDVFMDTIPHAMGLLRNEVHDCARK